MEQTSVNSINDKTLGKRVLNITPNLKQIIVYLVFAGII